jgi:hypothetical protein
MAPAPELDRGASCQYMSPFLHARTPTEIPTLVFGNEAVVINLGT